MLRVRALQSGYGQSQVLFGVDLDIAAAEIVTLLGRNGMGKTTTVMTLMGLVPAWGGEASFEGANLIGAAPERVARLGVGLVPEGRMIFSELTVRENLVATAANRLARPDSWTLARVFDLFPRLKERKDQMARTMSGGEQQMLAIGRALTTNPRLLVLDEATEGLAPVIRAEIWRCVETLKAQGQSILVIDKNVHVLQRIADRHVIIERGRTVWSGTSAQLRETPDLVTRYVGV
ncbi:MAG TPA: ABC transporter ATP-binding protein [Rhodoblastus sp.]|nr:ABC transporter ATP-binding protein [Rhodoblastus sp.]